MHTIKEVARRARVSVGTVSNVLSGAVPVSKRLKERVLEVIKQLDYHPDHVARSLKIRKTRTLGLLINDLTDPISPQLILGAEDAALNTNYVLITFNSFAQTDRQERALHALRSRRVDGILLVASPGTETARIRAIQDAGTPVVCVGRELPGLDSTVVNHFGSARDCVRHLASNGHSRIGFLNSNQQITAVHDRYEGYGQGLKDSGLAFNSKLVAAAGPEREDGMEAARRLLLEGGSPFALVAANAMLGIAVLQAARQMSLRCPEDVALVVFDDSKLSEAFTPSLTAMAQPGYELGRKSVELLLRRMSQPERRRTRMVLPTALHIRESCGTRISINY